MHLECNWFRFTYERKRERMRKIERVKRERGKEAGISLIVRGDASHLGNLFYKKRILNNSVEI